MCSDLTKRFERIYRGLAPAVLSELQDNPNVERGEYCLAVDISMLPKVEMPAQRPAAIVFMLERLLDGEALSEAAEKAMCAGYARNEVYRARVKIDDMFEV